MSPVVRGFGFAAIAFGVAQLIAPQKVSALFRHRVPPQVLRTVGAQALAVGGGAIHAGDESRTGLMPHFARATSLQRFERARLIPAVASIVGALAAALTTRLLTRRFGTA